VPALTLTGGDELAVFDSNGGGSTGHMLRLAAAVAAADVASLRLA